jgi:hypothetical protein
MINLKNHSTTLIFATFIAVSLLVGWFIPGFYAWTDSNQSRPSPLLWKVPLWAAIGSVAFCLVLPWLPIASKTPSMAPAARMRFGLGTLLMLTTAVAIATALLAEFPFVVSGIVCAGSFAYFVPRSETHDRLFAVGDIDVGVGIACLLSALHRLKCGESKLASRIDVGLRVVRQLKRFR